MDVEVPQLITVPSLHVLGRADELLSAAQLLSVPSRCESMTMLWHKGGHVVPLLDGAVAAALRRFLGAEAGANALPQEGTPPVLQQQPRQIPSHDTLSTATRILADLKGSPVESSMPLVSLGLSSVQVIQFRSQLCEALHIPVESLPLSMLMQGVGEGNSIEEIVAALQSVATDQRRSEPETPVPELPPKESHETSLVWACTLCACILQPITFLVRALSFWTPVVTACAIDYAIFGPTALRDAAEASHHGLGNLALAFALVYSRLLISCVVTFISVCLKWLLVGRLRPTPDAPHRWPVLAHFRWRSGRIIHAQLEPALECFRGTSILTYILRALGTRVHRSATIETTQIFDWDLVELGPHAILQEKASISAAHLHLSDIRFERVVVDALVGTGAHASAGAHVFSPVAPLACASKQSSVSSRISDIESGHSATSQARPQKKGKCPLLTWFAAESAVGLLSALSQLLTLVFAIATLVAFGDPWPEGITRGLVHAAESNYYESPWRAAILCMIVVVVFASITLQPLVFTCLAVLARRLFVSTARDGDDATATIGSRFLEVSLRHEDFKIIAAYFALADRLSVLLRALGMPIAPNASLPDLPLLDRPELVTIESGCYTGGFLVLCNKQFTPAGPRFRSIALKSGSFVANGVVLQPGSSIGPNAVLGNRAVAPEAESLQNGIWWGNPLLLLKRTENETSVLDQVNHSAAGVTVLPVLGAILVNAVMVCPFVAMLPVMLCVTTTPSDAYQNGVPTRNGAGDIYCRLLMWLVPWLAIVWWVVAALLWKLVFVGSFLSSLERVTTRPSSPLRDRVRELNEVVMFVVDAVCGPIKGTPLYSGVLRLLGMSVGRNVCWLGERCPEPDLLSVGDGTLVAPGVDFFTHNRETVSYVFEVSSTCQDGHGLRVVV
jgi:non-ribosomal peptide synthetase-like protein